MLVKLILLVSIMYSALLSLESKSTETLFMDPSLSLESEYDFVKFPYLSAMSKFVAPKLDGGIFRLSDYVGDLEKDLKLKRYYKRFKDDPRKTLVISFFASYCEPCKKEIPELLEITEELASERDDVLLLLIGMDGTKSALTAFIENNEFELGNNTVVLLNPPRNKLSPASIMNVEKLPSLFIVNREGNIILEHHGFKDGTDIKSLVENIILNYEGMSGDSQ